MLSTKNLDLKHVLPQETYALKRKLRQSDSSLKDLWKEREECAKQLRTLDPHRLSTPQSKFSKADVIKELKWVSRLQHVFSKPSFPNLFPRLPDNFTT